MTEDELKKELKKISGYDKMIKNLNLELQYIEDGIFSQSVLTNSKVKTSLSNRTENKIVDTLGMKDNILDQIQVLIVFHFLFFAFCKHDEMCNIKNGKRELSY